MAEKVQGTVKWFSNKKGYGFITPADVRELQEDVFVHQSSIFCEGYRTLDEGWEVEFEIGHDDDGKAKAVSVTAPGGGPCFGPRKSRPNPRRRDGGRAARTTARGPPKPKEPFWHETLNEGVKGMIEEKSIRTSTGTIDVSVGDARVKLGTNGYSSVAHADGVLAEGSFTCDEEGISTFNWEHIITFDKSGGQWVATEDNSVLPATFCLADGKSLLAHLIHTNPLDVLIDLSFIDSSFLFSYYQPMFSLLALMKPPKLYGVTLQIPNQLWKRMDSRCVMLF
ncbi:hypothetical protein ACHAXR_010912 [Thalassiosira sp. AJA248-18]